MMTPAMLDRRKLHTDIREQTGWHPSKMGQQYMHDEIPTIDEDDSEEEEQEEQDEQTVLCDDVA